MIESVDIAAGPFDHEDLFSLVVLQSQKGLLMGRKQRGFGKSRLVLPGGKDRFHIGLGAILLRPGHLDAAQELHEETGVTTQDLVLENRLGLTIVDESDGGELRTISIYAGHVDSAQIRLRDSSELHDVSWQTLDSLTYGEMPDDYQTWLPSVLAGYAVSGTLITDGETLLGGTALRISREPGVRPEALPVLIR